MLPPDFNGTGNLPLDHSGAHAQIQPITRHQTLIVVLNVHTYTKQRSFFMSSEMLNLVFHFSIKR